MQTNNYEEEKKKTSKHLFSVCYLNNHENNNKISIKKVSHSKNFICIMLIQYTKSYDIVCSVFFFSFWGLASVVRGFLRVFIIRNRQRVKKKRKHDYFGSLLLLFSEHLKKYIEKWKNISFYCVRGWRRRRFFKCISEKATDKKLDVTTL